MCTGNTKNVRIVVMKNLLPSGLELHHKFDLKGSTYGRKASKKGRFLPSSRRSSRLWKSALIGFLMASARKFHTFLTPHACMSFSARQSGAQIWNPSAKDL